MIDFDTTRPVTGYDDLVRLVVAVLSSDDPGAEHHAIEWKSALDLRTPAGSFHVARAVVGFANRPVKSALRHFGGWAYVLVGVEPGDLVGVPQWDGQQLTPLLAKYLGGADGPVWHHDNVTVDDKSVLVISVHPPADGDHIHTIRKQFTAAKADAREGEIFVRRNGSTSRPNTSEVRALEQRLLDRNRLQVSVTPTAAETPVAMILDLSPQSQDAWMVAAEAAVRARPVAPRTLPAKFPEGLLPLLQDQRTPAQFESEVSGYLTGMRAVLEDCCRNIAASIIAGRRLSVTVTNDSDEPVEDLLVRIDLPAGFEALHEIPEPKVPKRPLPLGEQSIVESFLRTPNVLFGASGTSNPLGPTVRNGVVGSQIRYSVRRLHPNDPLDLEPVVILANTDVTPGSLIKATVRVTASGRRGETSFTLPITTSPKTYPPLDLMRGGLSPSAT